jgi:hypothetical protein
VNVWAKEISFRCLTLPRGFYYYNVKAMSAWSSRLYKLVRKALAPAMATMLLRGILRNVQAADNFTAFGVNQVLKLSPSLSPNAIPHVRQSVLQSSTSVQRSWVPFIPPTTFRRLALGITAYRNGYRRCGSRNVVWSLQCYLQHLPLGECPSKSVWRT